MVFDKTLTADTLQKGSPLPKSQAEYPNRRLSRSRIVPRRLQPSHLEVNLTDANFPVAGPLKQSVAARGDGDLSCVAILNFAASAVVDMVVPAVPGRRGAKPPAEASRREAGTIEFPESSPERPLCGHRSAGLSAMHKVALFSAWVVRGSSE